MMFSASAPSNIALIKYMGKLNTPLNKATNSSFSYTLESLRSFVEISEIAKPHDEWALLEGPGLQGLDMEAGSQTRYLSHFQKLKREWGIDGHYLIKSANNFPGDCGLASSASSFAALTMATAKLAEAQGYEAQNLFDLAEVSRQGSGSSCRSFFGPWVLWGPSGVRPLEFPLANLGHQVIVVAALKKKVSSSEAHRRVATSPLFEGRPERAEHRLALMLNALRGSNWTEAFELAWAEFWDMHAMFETSKPAFGYFEPATIEILGELRKQWEGAHDGPIVTMDAGANIHLLYRDDQKDLQKQTRDRWQNRFQIFESHQAPRV